MPPPPVDQSDKTLFFNAPALALTDNRRTPGNDLQTHSVSTGIWKPIGERAGDLLVNSRSSILTRKAWFAPDTTYPSDWEDSSEDEAAQQAEEDSSDTFWSNVIDGFTYGNGGNGWLSGPIAPFTGIVRELFKPDVPVGKPLAIKDNTKYGFRFMYNPSSLSFSLGMNDSGINASALFTGALTAVNILPSGSTIYVDFEIHRVEDMYFLNPLRGQKSVPAELSAKMKGLYQSGPVSNSSALGKEGLGIGDQDLIDIADKGTMYDLDFLFRSVIGRQWETTWRGMTADVGLAWFVPLVLHLSDKMVYRARLSSANYTHIQFTENMVPTVTRVNLGFERLPDVVNFASLT